MRFPTSCNTTSATWNNVAPINYLEFLLNNRKKRVQSFEVISSTGQNVFASLNAVSQMLLHKFSKQGDSRTHRRGCAGRRAGRTRHRAENSRSRHRMNCIPCSDDRERRHARRHPRQIS